MKEFYSFFSVNILFCYLCVVKLLVFTMNLKPQMICGFLVERFEKHNDINNG